MNIFFLERVKANVDILGLQELPETVGGKVQMVWDYGIAQNQDVSPDKNFLVYPL